MHHTPNPKAKADTLKALFAEHGLELGHQQSLEYTARLEGYKDWQTCSAATKQADEPEQGGLHIQPCDDTQGLELYTAMATAEVSMSAQVGVWAEDKSDARWKLASFAAELFNSGKGFALDDGNMRDSGDMEFNGTIECVSKPEVEGDDFSASATWKVDEFVRSISLERNNPGSQDNDDRFAKVTATFTLSNGFFDVSKMDKSYQVYSELKNYLYDAIPDGDFDDTFEALQQRLEGRIRAARRKLGRRSRG